MTWSKNLWPDGRCDHLANHIRVDLAGAPPGSNSYCTAVELPTDGGGRLGTPRRWPHNLSRRTVATGAMLDQFRPDVQGNSPFIVGVSGHRISTPRNSRASRTPLRR